MTIDTIVFATQNEGKVIEMKSLLADLQISVISAKEAGVTDDVIEDGDTLEANALKKAQHVASKTSHWSVADDSGLFIKSLNNAPGVLSSRWAGSDFPKEQLCDFALEKMAGVPDGQRSAYWKCTIALVSPTGEHWIFTGQVNGKITIAKRGQPRPHMPYDTIFLPEGEARTFAEMNEREKNALSHRGRAIAKLKQFIIENFHD